MDKDHPQYRHGMSNSRPYKIWCNMKERCDKEKNKSFKNYGGHGIKICKAWYKFENFWTDMEAEYFEEATIDRKDNNRGYCKENCRWATWDEQAKNRRNNHKLTLNGKTQNLVDWAKETGLKRYAIMARLKRGWSTKKALTTPLIYYQGVSYDKARKKWKAYYKQSRKQIFIGRFNTKKDAIKARQTQKNHR